MFASPFSSFLALLSSLSSSLVGVGRESRDVACSRVENGIPRCIAANFALSRDSIEFISPSFAEIRELRPLITALSPLSRFRDFIPHFVEDSRRGSRFTGKRWIPRHPYRHRSSFDCSPLKGCEGRIRMVRGFYISCGAWLARRNDKGALRTARGSEQSRTCS